MATWTFNPENFVQQTGDTVACNGCDWEAPVATRPSAMTDGQANDRVATGMMVFDHMRQNHNVATVDADWSAAGTRWTGHEKV